MYGRKTMMSLKVAEAEEKETRLKRELKKALKKNSPDSSEVQELKTKLDVYSNVKESVQVKWTDTFIKHEAFSFSELETFWPDWAWWNSKRTRSCQNDSSQNWPHKAFTGKARGCCENEPNFQSCPGRCKSHSRSPRRIWHTGFAISTTNF